MTVRRPGLGLLVQVLVACWFGFEIVPSRYVFLSSQLGFAMAFTVVATLSILGHELAHATVAAATTRHPTQVRTFGPLLGLATIDDPDTGEAIDAWTIRAVAAGPIFNLVVAAIAWHLLRTASPQVSIEVSDLLRLVFLLNVGIGVLNLLPIGPLDGGRILLLVAQRGSGRTQVIRARLVQGLSVGLSSTMFLALLADSTGHDRSAMELINIGFWALLALVAVYLADPGPRRRTHGIVPALVGVALGVALAQSALLSGLR